MAQRRISTARLSVGMLVRIRPGRGAHLLAYPATNLRDSVSCVVREIEIKQPTRPRAPRRYVVTLSVIADERPPVTAGEALESGLRSTDPRVTEIVAAAVARAKAEQ